MSGLTLIPVFRIGLLGSVHCIGMCGGIVSAFSMAPARRRPFPVRIAVRTDDAGAVLLRTLSYNTGRIASYAAAGALAGGFASGARLLAGIAAWQAGAYILAHLMLVLLGLYLTDVWRGLTRLEALGQVLWKRIEPLTAVLLPLDSPLKLLLAGGLWGWLPCGMVYSVLLSALLSGSAAAGAAVMLAFGLGTLPVLLAAGMFGAQLRSILQRRHVRLASGLIVLLFGLFGFLRASHGLTPDWLEMLCLSETHVEGRP